MLCEVCNTEITSKFVHAIKNNQCPACGSSIMKREKLVVYIKLCEFLEQNIVIKNINTDILAACLIANFNIKEFSSTQQGSESLESIDVKEVDLDPDAEHKKKQKVEAKEILQKMRDDVLEEVSNDRYGFGDSDEISMGNGSETVNVDTREFVAQQLQEERADRIQPGGTGPFSRSE